MSDIKIEFFPSNWPMLAVGAVAGALVVALLVWSLSGKRRDRDSDE